MRWGGGGKNDRGRIDIQDKIMTRGQVLHTGALAMTECRRRGPGCRSKQKYLTQVQKFWDLVERPPSHGCGV